MKTLSDVKVQISGFTYGEKSKNFPYKAYREIDLLNILKELKKDIWNGKTIYSYQDLQTIKLEEVFEIIDKRIGGRLNDAISKQPENTDNPSDFVRDLVNSEYKNENKTN